ncbi:MAG: hypothetical protein JW751_09225 [Polyangiaceae bacterium]|nr:hypothetical protein [Polyangiaceae bacterium]
MPDANAEHGGPTGHRRLEDATVVPARQGMRDPELLRAATVLAPDTLA